MVETNPERLERLLKELAEYTDTPGKGVTRLTFSDTYFRARAFLIEQLDRLGMQTRITAHGNLRSRLPGKAGMPAVLVGSHIDSVVNGGAYDGTVGVVAAIEAVRVISESNVARSHPIDVMIFAEEEGARFGSMLTGSKAAVGQLSPGELKELRDMQGKSYLECLQDVNLNTGSISQDLITPAEVKAMLELHIEQSVVLEQAQIPIGIVDRIAGSRHVLVSVDGVSNHAGATPMALRADALAGSAEMIGMIESTANRSAQAGSRLVATVGRMAIIPNAPNVIPGHVEFTIDLRDVDTVSMENALADIRNAIENVARRRGLEFNIRLLSSSAPIALSSSLVQQLEAIAESLGISYMRLPSGAVHDAGILAQMTEVGMIFIPSRGGRSHCPEEFSSIEDIKRGTDVLLHALIQLARSGRA